MTKKRTIRKKKTAFFIACSKGHLDLVKYLYSLPTLDPNKRDAYLRTPFYEACKRSHFAVVKFLIEQPNIDIKASNYYKRTPLSVCEDPEIMKLLLADSRIDPDIRDVFGNSPLHLASSVGNHNICNILLADPRIDPRSLNEDNVTALHFALMFRQENIVQILLKDPRIDPNILNQNGDTALHNAVRYGIENIVQVLLEDPRVDPNILNQDGDTALHYAVIYGEENIMRILLENPRVDYTILTSNGSSLLHIIASTSTMNYNNNIFRELLSDQRFNPVTKNKDNETPLDIAVSNYRGTDPLQCLLSDPRIDPNTFDEHGWSPLYYSAYFGKVEMCRILLDNPKINPVLSNEYGETPLSIAVEKGHEKIVRMFLADSRIDPNTMLLITAAKYSQFGIMRILLEDQRINPNFFINNDTYLSTLCKNDKNFEAVKVMIGCKRTDINLRGHYEKLQNPFTVAVINKCEKITKYLLTQPSLNLSHKIASYSLFDELLKINGDDVRTLKTLTFIEDIKLVVTTLTNSSLGLEEKKIKLCLLRYPHLFSQLKKTENTQFNQLIETYRKNPRETFCLWIKDLELSELYAAKVFAYVCAINDNYYEIIHNKTNKMSRYMKILCSLNTDTQEKLILLTFQSKKSFIPELDIYFSLCLSRREASKEGIERRLDQSVGFNTSFVAFLKFFCFC